MGNPHASKGRDGKKSANARRRKTNTFLVPIRGILCFGVARRDARRSESRRRKLSKYNGLRDDALPKNAAARKMMQRGNVQRRSAASERKNSRSVKRMKLQSASVRRVERILGTGGLMNSWHRRLLWNAGWNRGGRSGLIPALRVGV